MKKYVFPYKGLNPKELDFDNENILIFNIIGAEQPI